MDISIRHDVLKTLWHSKLSVIIYSCHLADYATLITLGDDDYNTMTMKALQRSREPVLVLRHVLESRPITALVAASPQTSGPCGGRKEGQQGRKGSVTPLDCVNVGP